VIASVCTDRLATLSMYQCTSAALTRVRFLVDVDNDVLRLTLLSLACFVSVTESLSIGKRKQKK